MENEKNLVIERTGQSVINKGGIPFRQKFEEEMEKMESDMSRYRAEVVQLERRYANKDAAPSPDSVGVETKSGFRKWSTVSPLIHESSEGKVLKLRFDLREFTPEEINVKITGNEIHVEARREDKTGSTVTVREYKRQFPFPECTQLDRVTANLSSDGVLDVEAPIYDS